MERGVTRCSDEGVKASAEVEEEEKIAERREKNDRTNDEGKEEDERSFYLFLVQIERT